MSDNENIAIEKKFRKLEVTKDLEVKINFDEILTLPPLDEGGESRIKVRHHSVFCEDVPHSDLLDALKKLKPHAFDINEMDHPEAKKKQDYRVCAVQVDGDMVLQKSRVKFTMIKHVGRTGKEIKIGPTGQVRMYGQSDYAEHEAMSKLVEKLVDEVWLYLGGKFDEDPEVQPTQLPIFERHHFELV